MARTGRARELAFSSPQEVCSIFMTKTCAKRQFRQATVAMSRARTELPSLRKRIAIVRFVFLFC